jgi:UDP-N-acetylmuramoyl-tripeptide--D-alanyl-D-alanine ligase
LRGSQTCKVLINADDPSIAPRYKDIKQKKWTYGIEHEGDFHLSIDEDLGWEGFIITITFPEDRIKTRTGLLGTHNLYNILSASAIAYSAGLEKRYIQAAIETFSPYSMRMRPVFSKKGYTVVDDSYNANPSSMEWAIRTLTTLPCKGKRIAILGDMKELGEKSSLYHRELGRSLKASGIPLIILTGEAMEDAFSELGAEKAKLFGDRKALIEYVTGKVDKDDVILVKGSRAARMDEIVEALT